MTYSIYLRAEDDGTVILNVLTENSTNRPRPDHWPAYTLCQNPDEVPNRLTELGLTLAAGSHLTDVAKRYCVYLHHPDLTALRAQLDSDAPPQPD